MTAWISNGFEMILQMSLTASFVCLAVCLVRLLLKRAPKIFSYVLWALVFIRMICPVAVGSPVSVVPSRQQWLTWSEMAVQDPGWEQSGDLRPSIGQQLSDPQWANRENGRVDGDTVQMGQNGSQTTGMANGIVGMVDKQDETMSRPLSDHKTGQSVDTVGSSERHTLTVAAMVWFIGALVILSWQGVRSYRWKRSLGQTRSVGDGVYTASGAAAPFVMGLLHPAIYLPEQMASEEREYVLLHERTHLRRKDYLVKMVAFGICCVHWFNPFAWLAFRLMCMDMEMSCDEAVLQQMNGQQKKAYATALLSFADRTVSGGSLAFGEPYAKKRIRNVLRYRRPAYRWMLVLTVMCVALAGCLLTDPMDDGSQENNDTLETQESKEQATQPDTTEPETMPSEMQQEESENETTEDDLYFARMEAYWESFRVGSTAPQITDQSMRWEADLNHDGTPEQIVFDWGYMDMADPAMFAVLDNQGTVVYMEDPANAHVGWMNYYVCEWNDREYLLSYSPYVSTGILGYYYNLMELDDQGKMVMVDQGNASCILGDGEFIREFQPDEYMNIPDMVAFAMSINDYLEHSYLLFSTDEDWVELDYAANELFVIGNPDSPYRQYENYEVFSGEPRNAQKPSEDQLRQALLEWCVEMEYPYTEDGITIFNAPMTEDEWLDAWERHLDSYQIGSTKPQISDKSTSWYADLDHDGVDERIVFDWSMSEADFGGMLAVLDAQGAVLFSAELITDHGFSQTYYLCNHEGKAYIFRYKPYSMQGEQDYGYELFYLTEYGDKIVESEQMIHFSNQEWPGAANENGKRVMNIPEMVEFAETVNGYLEDSYLLVSTDHDFVGAWFQGGEGEYISYVLGSEEDPHRAREVYEVFHDPDVVPEVAQIEDIAEKLKTWCEKTGIPYQE